MSQRHGKTGRKRVNWPHALRDACRLIERESLKLDTLATRVGVSRAELQRQFTRRLGVSPRGYSQALALQRLARASQTGRNTLDAVLEAGFEANSTAYNTVTGAFGVAPGRLRAGIVIGWWVGLSDLGWMLLGATQRGICWLAFGHEPGAMLEELRAAFPKSTLVNDQDRLYEWFERVREFVLLPRESLDLPVDVQGTAFQSRVWRALREIPLGTTAAYGAVAKRIGQPAATRAVASACANNPVALLIPCHRVVGSDGRPTGYRWGVARKRTLIARERRGGSLPPAMV
jgi:AraC family transcriptional regulator of adaptative response/methylated-DNA-[protein]-cysteine methyltransferase